MELQSDKALLHGEVLSDQLTRWCCIDRLSSHDELGVSLSLLGLIAGDKGDFTTMTRRAGRVGVDWRCVRAMRGRRISLLPKQRCP
jgi:hypothetical protein